MVGSLAAGTITAASAIVKQDWEVNFELGGKEVATLAGQLQAACQLVSPDCVLTSEGSSRRHMESDDTVEVTKMRALQTSTGTATLRRSLATGPLNGEISNLAANSGVAVTSINFIGAQAALVISQQGSAVEAQQLRYGSLAPNLVRATVAALLGLSATDVEVSVEEPIFPPMPPPSLPPSPPASPPQVPLLPPSPLSPDPSPPPAVASLPVSLPPPLLPASRSPELESETAISVADDGLSIALIASIASGAAAGLALIGLCCCLYKRMTKGQLSAAGQGAKKEDVQVTITHEPLGTSGHPDGEAEGDVTAPPGAVPGPNLRNPLSVTSVVTNVEVTTMPAAKVSSCTLGLSFPKVLRKNSDPKVLRKHSDPKLQERLNRARSKNMQGSAASATTCVAAEQSAEPSASPFSGELNQAKSFDRL